MKEIIKKLENKIIVSVQASGDEPLNTEDCIAAMALSVINGGASGLRLAGKRDIKKIRSITDLPILGITKPEPLPTNWKEVVYITPDFEHAKSVSDAGADIVAIDGTSRPRPKETLEELINKIHTELKKPVMVDISTLEEGLNCQRLGADIISTTLSGYTQETLDKNTDEPDFELVEKLVKNLNIPIILEGRVWEPEHVKKAFELGVYSVVIGSAITRPQLITKRFVSIL